MSNKRICLIANSGFTIVNFRAELIKELIFSDNDVIVICPLECDLMHGRDLTEEFSNLGVKFVPIVINRSGINPISEFNLLISLYNVLRNEMPDVVLNYTIKPTIYGSFAAWLAGVKYIASNITGLGYVFTTRSIGSFILSSIIKLQYKLALRCNSIVFFQNPDDEALFKKLSLTSSVKTKVIDGSGVDVAKFIRKNFDPKPHSFIFVGRLLCDKGVKELIGAAEIIKSKYPHAIITLLGSIDNNPSSLTEYDLKDYIASGVINYLPARPDVRDALDEHEVFVLPSYREGTPRSVLEAMSMSMPIITTDVPGCRETVVSGTNGFLVEPKNAEKLAIAMEEFILKPDLVKKFGEASRELAINRYEVNKVNESILSEFI